MDKFLKHKNLLAFAILFGVAVINYWRVPFLFWQQDEWVTFANLIQNGMRIVWHGLEVKSTHFSSISNFLTFLCFQIFRFNPAGYLFLGLLFHLINGFFIYKIAEKIKVNFFYSLAIAVLFVTSSASYQLLMWPIVSLNTISLTFTLLAILILIDFVKNKTHALFRGTVVTCLTALSLFTIEYSAGIIVFIPLALVFYKNKLGIRNIGYFLVPFVLFIIFYIGFRFYYSTPQNVVVSSNQSTFNTLIQNGLSYPLYYFGQVYIPENITIELSKIVAKRTDTDENLNFFRITLIISLLIIISIIYIIRRVNLHRSPGLLKILVLTFLFIGISSLPFIFLAGGFTIIPSRYLYFGSAGAPFLLGLLLLFSRKKSAFIYRLLFTLTVIFILSSIYQNFQKSKDLYYLGEIRKSILESIQLKYPKLPPKSVFYFQSDTSYYGLPSEEKIPPFQAGLGQILLVWYYNQTQFPMEFYKDEYLWKITDENYKEVDAFGYGYFRNWNKLQKAVSQYKLSPNSIIAFSWKGETNSLSDITPLVREKLSNYSSEFTR